MSWFGFGGQAPAKKDDALKNTDDLMSQPTFPNSQSAGNSNSSKFESELMAEQEHMFVQALISNLTEVAFDKCVSKPTSQLSATERNCIAAVTMKYLDTNEFVFKNVAPSLMNQQN